MAEALSHKGLESTATKTPKSHCRSSYDFPISSSIRLPSSWDRGRGRGCWLPFCSPSGGTGPSHAGTGCHLWLHVPMGLPEVAGRKRGHFIVKTQKRTRRVHLGARFSQQNRRHFCRSWDSRPSPTAVKNHLFPPLCVRLPLVVCSPQGLRKS